MSQTTSPGNGTPSLSLHYIIAAATQRRRLVLIFFVTVVGLVTLVSLLTPHVYQANARLLVERDMDTEKALILRMNSMLGNQPYNWINGEMAIIRSNPVAEAVIRKLKRYPEGYAPRGSAGELSETALRELTEDFLEKLSVSNARESNVLNVAFQDADPRQAAAVVDEVIRAYIAYRSELYKDADAYQFFEEQMRIADRRLQELEQRQADFKTEAEMISPESQRAILINRLSDYDRRLTELQTRRINKETRLEVVRRQLQQATDISIPNTESSESPSRVSHITRLKNEILNLEIERQRLLQEYTPQYVEVVNIEQQIEAARQQIAREVQQIVREEEASLQALQAEEQILRDLVQRTRQEISDLAQREYELAQLSRGIEDNREIYSILLKQREEARISLAKLQEDVKIKVINPAVAGVNPVSPNKKLNVLLAMVFGLVGGVGLAVGLEKVKG